MQWDWEENENNKLPSQTLFYLCGGFTFFNKDMIGLAIRRDKKEIEFYFNLGRKV